MASDLQNRYNYVFDNTTDTYNFTTKNNICCRVSFVVEQTFSTLSGQEISGIYQLVVEKETEELEPFDSKVRHKVFSRWYETSFYRETIVKMDNIVKVDIGEDTICVLYTSFMFHKQNPEFETLIEIYGRIEAVLNAEK
ncbi:MAG: hypothetical protein KF870_11555 [Leadbetterella sp.]|nr:hypothetical protein [Leadbetterella sp.]